MSSLTGKKRKLSTEPKATTAQEAHHDLDGNDHGEFGKIVSKTTIMDLPKELLVQIIGYTLINPSPITLRKPHEYRWAKELDSLHHTSGPRKIKRRRTRRAPLLNTLLVCRDFYFAGLEAYHGGNIFHFDTPLDFRETFIDTLSDRHKACVKNVIIDWDWYCIELGQPKQADYFAHCPWALQRDLLESFPKLDSAVVNCQMKREPVYFAAASRAGRAKSQIQERVLKAWPSNARKIQFVFPQSWGVLTDM